MGDGKSGGSTTEKGGRPCDDRMRWGDGWMEWIIYHTMAPFAVVDLCPTAVLIRQKCIKVHAAGITTSSESVVGNVTQHYLRYIMRGFFSLIPR